MMYDVIIVGAGLFGSVFAAEVRKQGRSVLVLDKRDHTGGFCDSYPDPTTGVEVHRYGTHAFHTNDKRVWDWLHQYATFYPYRHQVRTTTADGRIFGLPVNLDTLERFYNKKLTPKEAADLVKRPAPPGSSFETTAKALVGAPLYDALIRGYTLKHWGCDPATLPGSIIKRLPIYTSYRTDYFPDRYQGVPEDGYGSLFRRLLEGVDVQLQTKVTPDQLDNLRSRCHLLVWTGALDDFYGCDLGRLGWRSIKLTTEILSEDDHQGCVQMNYADPLVPWTRKHEPKHMRPDKTYSGTVVQVEYPGDDANDPAYPMRRGADTALYAAYKKRADQEANVLFGGRLANYLYYDMHQVVASALWHANQNDFRYQTSDRGPQGP